MNTLEPIQALKDAKGLSKSEATPVADIFFNGMAEALANGDPAEIRGLYSIFAKENDRCTGRAPKTGEALKV